MGNVFKSPEQRKHWNKYNNEYSKKNYRTFCLKLSKTKDKEIIEFLENSNENVTTVLKKLLREKIGSR